MQLGRGNHSSFQPAFVQESQQLFAEKTFEAVGVLGSARNARSISGTRFRAVVFRARASHAVRESVAVALAERLMAAFNLI